MDELFGSFSFYFNKIRIFDYPQFSVPFKEKRRNTKKNGETMLIFI